MKAMFVGHDGDDTTPALEAFGRIFPRGQAIDISDMPAAVQAKIAGNSHFVVEGAASPPPPPAPEKKKGKG
jgi:hypothetical protein